MKAHTPTVFVVDDDGAVRSSLRLLLKSVGLAVSAFDSTQAFLDAYSQQWAGCILLDVRMPGMSGPVLQEQLALRGSMLPVIFITGHGDISMAVEAMQKGALDFVEKPFHDQELLDRVQHALAQDARVRRQSAEQETIRSRFDSLTPREHEVLEQVTLGSSNKVMAYDLRISQRTIEIHRSRIMQKMQAPSLAQLVRMTRSMTTSGG